jgi:hypothetical protein
MINKNKRYSFFYVLYYFYFFSICHVNILICMMGQPQPFGQGNMMPNQLNDMSKQQQPLNKYNWDQASSAQLNTVIEDQATTQFNWQQRRVIKQNAYAVYTNLTVVIDDIKAIIMKFSNKIDNIKFVLDDFNKTISKKCAIFGAEYVQPNNFLLFVEKWHDAVAVFKKTVYYNLHKDFRKKIDIQWQYFDNIKNMINHYQNSIIKMINLGNILINSVNTLYGLEKKAVAYEEQAWEKYQQLDDLIGDVIAQENYLNIVNCSDNILAINAYLRNEFLGFFNQGMSNLNDANIEILNAIDDLINHISHLDDDMNAFANEINDYDEQQKNKIALEVAEKIRIEDELKMKELNKKKAIELALQQRPWYQKIVPMIYDYFNSFVTMINKIFSDIITLSISYFNTIIENNFKTISKKNNSNEVVKTVVSNEVAALAPVDNGQVQVVSFTTPQPVVPLANQADITVKIDANNKPIAQAVAIPGESFIEDVFNKEHPVPLVEEKDKIGASSYPQRINPQYAIDNQLQVPPVPIDPNAPISLLASENIKLPDIVPVDAKESEEKLQFRYQKIDQSDLSDINTDDKLLPDLPDLVQQRPSNSSGLGTQMKEGVVAFNAGRSSEKIVTNRTSKSEDEKSKEESRKNQIKKNKRAKKKNNPHKLKQIT